MKKLLSLFTALVLCTAMWGATYKTFYKVEGALYQGINVDFTTNKNMFVPNGATVTYSSFDGKAADWWANGKQKKTNVSYITIPDLADANYFKYQIKNYTGYDAQDPKIDYIYGTSSGDYLLRAGSGTMYMMSMANAYAVCTEDSKTPTNVGKYTVVSRTESGSTDYVEKYGTYMMYGTDFTHATYGAVKAYDMLVDNPGEMYIDYIVLPIFGYPKTDETTIEKMIPNSAELTLTLYPIDLNLSDAGVYSYTRKTTPITTVTANANNFTADGDNLYRGTVKFTPENPLLISGDFVARLTWDDGCNFGLITDNYNLQNYTTWYYCADKKVHYIWNGGGRNASISYHAMFPTLEKKDNIETLEFASTGEESKEVAIKSNIDPADTENFRISYSGDGADWISHSFRYTTAGKYVAKENVYITFKAEANTTGETREATITLKHHLKELTYTVTQVPEVSSISILNSKSEKIEELSLKATETETLTASVLPETTTQDVTWVSEDENIATVEDGKVTAVGAGTTTIKAISADPDEYATCEVTVTPKLTAINVPKNKLTAPSVGGDACFDDKTEFEYLRIELLGTTFKNDEWKITKPTWVTATYGKSTKEPSNIIFKFTATENSSGATRQDNIKIEAYGYTFEYSISQASLPSAYYEVPAGAFFAGMTDNSSAAEQTFYLPYEFGQEYTFTSTEAGDWASSEEGTPDETKTKCSYTSCEMKGSYHIPQLQVENKVNYQYGASSTTYNEDLYFHVGNPDMHYMTPARLWSDLTVANYTQGEGGYAGGYKTNASETMGVYFNNIDNMYIDGISIPISAGSTEAAKQKTKDDLFGENGNVTVNIYRARIEGDNKEKVDVDNPIWTGTLTNKDIIFTPLSQTESYRGALNATFEPRSIAGPFVIELSEMNTTGCDFYVLSDKSNGKNKWGYYVQSGTTTYPKNYCLAVSVHAMFPALEKKDNKTKLEFTSEGGEDNVVVLSNIDPKSEDFTIDFGDADWISKGDITYDETSGESTLTFTAAANEGDARSTTITLTHHLKTLTYTVTQEAAPAPEPDFTRDVTAGNYGTICLPNAVNEGDYTGAVFYNVVGYQGEKDNPTGIVIESVVGNLEAGMPYIFRATATQIVATYTGVAVDAPLTDEDKTAANGLMGSFETKNLEGEYIYGIKDNALRKLHEEGNQVGANRAYIDMSQMSPAAAAPAPAPGVHRVIMNNSSYSAPTNLNGLNGNVKATKILRDGQLYIIRDGKTYNAQGIEL